MVKINTQKVGDRFVAVIKTLYAQAQSEKPDEIAQVMNKITVRREQLFRTYLDLPKFVKIESTRCQRTFKINNVSVEIEYGGSLKQFDKLIDGDAMMNTLLENEKALKQQRADGCKHLELLNNCLGSANLNKFKSYVRARFDSLNAVESFSDEEFLKVVKEFIHTIKPHTCKL